MTKQTTWEVSFHSDFDAEFQVFTKDVQDQLMAAANVIQRQGPSADRPTVGTLNNVKHRNMKELRFNANNGSEIWRAAFAFDTNRQAIILVAADKQGVDQKKFYKDLLKKANDRFDSHLATLRSAKSNTTKKSNKKI